MASVNQVKSIRKGTSQRINCGRAHTKKDPNRSTSDNANPIEELVGLNYVSEQVSTHVNHFDISNSEGCDVLEQIIFKVQRCRKEKNLERAKRIHEYLSNNKLECHKAIGNYIVPMFAECGSVFDAHHAFSRLHYQNEHSWTSLISGYIDCGQPQHAYDLYQEMQRNRVHPSSYTLVTLLRACSNVKDIEKGRQVHYEIKGKGFDKDTFVGNVLVDMYAKCGSLEEARKMFDKLPIQDVVSWNTLIAGYAEKDLSIEALSCFKEMQQSGISPDAITFVSILKACGSMRALDRGREIHIQISQKGFETDPFVGNTLIHMYVKCGSLSEAQVVFDKLPIRNHMSWTIIIAGYTEAGLGHEALSCFHQMELEGLPPDATTFVCSLRACASIGTIDRGRDIHAKISQKEFERDPSVCNALMDMYAKCGSLVDMKELFDKSSTRNIVSWTIMLVGYAANGLCQEALECFKRMKCEGLLPNVVTFVSILKACGRMKAIEEGQGIHFDICQRGLDKEIIVGNSLIDMYAKCGSMSAAWEVFAKLPNRDVVSWNTLILGYTENDFCQEALELFEQMQLEGVSPDAVTFVCSLKACSILRAFQKGQDIHIKLAEKGYEMELIVGNTLMDMYIKCGLIVEAQRVFDKMPVCDVVSWTTLISGFVENRLGLQALACFEQMHIPPNVFTYACSLQACARTRAIYKGRDIHNEVAEKGYQSDPVIGNALMAMYARCGSLTEAQGVFDKLPFQDILSWNILIAGYAEYGLSQEVLKCIEQMQLDNVSCNSTSFIFGLKACGCIGALKKGQQLHIDLVQKGYEEDASVCNSLVDMYMKCGAFADAKKVFEKLQLRDTTSWTILISGYTQNGLYKEALRCFGQMQSQAMPQSAVTFICALKACASLRAIDRARELQTEISEVRLERNLFISNTLIDVYGKCGCLEEAQESFDKLPTRDVASWNALITGYVDNGRGQEALNCYEQMKAEGVLPNRITLVCCLKACSLVGAISRGCQIHSEIKERGHDKELLVGTTLIDMYAKCGFLAHAKGVFENLPVHDPVTWTTMIRGYGTNYEGNMAVQCFEDMQNQGIKPDAITFTCLFTACSRASLVLKGQEYFKLMVDGYGIAPNMDHYNCMVDILSRAGQLYEAMELLESAKCTFPKETWLALLSACQTYRDVELGLKCFKQIAQMDPDDAASYVLMASIFASAGRWEDAKTIEKLRKQCWTKRKPGTALQSWNNKVHQLSS